MTDAETIVLPRVGTAEASVEDPWGEDHREATDGSATKAPWWRTAAWLLPGLLMGALGVIGAGVPGLWTDEFTTWGMATSSWRENWAMARGGDAIIDAPYHLLMRAWAEAIGASDLSLRAPSMLAMTVAAAVIGGLGARLFTPRTGLFAGMIFALLPTSTRYAQEARPHALAMLVAVLATAFLLRAVERPGFWRFAGYGLTVCVLGLLHADALLLLAGHGWVVLALHRRTAGLWLMAASGGALPAAALLWLGGRPLTGFANASNGALQWVIAAPRDLFGVTALGVVLLGLALFSLPLRYPAGVYTAWAVVPSLALLCVIRWEPVSLPQALSFTLPAWATLGAVALGRIRARWGAAVLVAIALAGYPVQAAFRKTDGHQQDTRQLAAIIEATSRPGDGVVYGSAEERGGWLGRDAVAHYLPADRRPADVLATRPQRIGGHLLAAECVDVTGCLAGTTRLWVIRVGEQSDPVRGLGPEKDRALRVRYQVAQVWYPKGLTLALLVEREQEGV